MVVYSLIIVILLVGLNLYFRIANRLNIIDKPNQRSSHSYITIRGGGVIFPIAAVLWYCFFGFQQPLIIIALVAMGIVSFLDDLLTLPNRIRIAIHFLSVGLLFWQLGLFGLPWYIIGIAFIITIGWINAFNFMDGINGITAFYSMVTIGTLIWLFENTPGDAAYLIDLLIILLISVVVFAFFNVRKWAKTFAGDVGSVSMAFLLAWFIIKLIMVTGHIEFMLFVSVYGIESVVTILYRLKRRENIFKAHRTHLYQYLSNEMGLSHILVSAWYASAQLIINILTIVLIKREIMTVSLFIISLLTLSAIYFLVRYITTKSERFVSMSCQQL